ncbi:MAG: hypothetical protein JRF07_02835 [Deltaproteobacteria bacterium]|jgi:hypothetical protein|nr:hypothetical protein [Deltaproteobacteria bacterium]
MSSDKYDEEKLVILRQEIKRGFSGEFRDFDIERIKRAIHDKRDDDSNSS